MKNIQTPSHNTFTVTVIDHEIQKHLTCQADTPLKTLLQEAGIRIPMPCGGNGLCKKCFAQISGKPCLICQTKVTQDITVILDQNSDITKILSSIENKQDLPQKICPIYSNYGISIDIGTTTICMTLIGENTFRSITRKNPQTVIGADVVSRIDSALQGFLSRLQHMICQTLNDMITELTQQLSIMPHDIDGAVITGNTAMLYFLTGRNPESLAKAPFLPDYLFGEYITGETLDLMISKKADIFLPPCISAFLGADMVTAVLSSAMFDHHQTALFIDIGTNGEIALLHENTLYCASTAAGPAFEGQGLSYGCYAVSGAIDKIWISNQALQFSTIDHLPAIGICGSGIVDGLAAMLELGMMNPSGYMESSVEFEHQVSISLADIREIQLAKSAIRAGIETLIEVSGVKKSQLEACYIAGGFGNYLNLKNAATIGLIPKECVPIAHSIGNAAHMGAVHILQNYTLIDQTKHLVKHAKVIPLASNSIFSEYFIKYLEF